MALLEKFFLDRLRALRGDALVTYPYGSVDFKRVERVYTVERSQAESAFLITDGEYTGTVLTDQRIVGGDHIYVEIYQRYDTLPGPVFVDSGSDEETGIPYLVARQLVLASVAYQTGELPPHAASITGISTGSTVTITCSAAHGIPQGAFVTFSSTNSTPNIDSQKLQVISVPSSTTFTVAPTSPVTVAGTTGAVVGVNRFVRELKSTNSVLTKVKIESMVACSDITDYNEDVPAWKDYAFPDVLQALTTYTDTSTGSSDGTSYGYSHSFGGSVAMKIKNGYRGPVAGRRKRYFSMGAPTATYAPTIIIPSTGQILVQGGSTAYRTDGTSETNSSSVSFKSQTIPPVLTNGIGLTTGSAGLATFTLALDASSPTSIADGTTIKLLDQPQKWRLGAWVQVVWELVTPAGVGT